MKKLLLLTVLVGIGSLASAQIGTGTIMIGGSLNFSSTSSKTTVGSTTTDGPKTTSFGIIPRAGYFLTDNFAIGLDIGYTNTTTTTTPATPPPDETKETSSRFIVGPFARYYSPISDNGGAFIHAQVGLSTGSDKTESTTGSTTTTVESDVTGFGVGISPGVYWFITRKIGLEAQYGFLGYGSQTTTTGDTEEKTSGFALNLDTRTIMVGFHYYMGR